MKLLDWLQKRWVYHIVIWLVVTGAISFLLRLVPEFDDLSTTSKIQLVAHGIAELMTIVYLNLYLKKRFFVKGSYWKYFVSITVFVFALYYLDNLLVTLFFSGNKELYGIDYPEIVFLILLSNLLHYFKQGVSNQYQFNELKVRTSEMELNGLKTQLNPHFLFNNLNNIYAINQIDPTIGSEMILELADVMRYHLQFSKLKKVPFSQEIQLLESYIELEKLRLTDNCDLQVSMQKPPPNLSIAPLLLLPFVENAFKYGVHPQRKCFLHIKLFCHQKQLSFSVENSVIQDKKTANTQIGISNTKKRLQLLYPKKHQLKITHNPSEFLVELTIDL